MKKISAFLVVCMLVTAIAMSFGPVQNVQAFSSSEIDYNEYNWYSAGKAGSYIYFSMSLDYDTAADLDLTGWKAALCPAGTKSLSNAVAVFDLTNDNKYIHSSSEWGQWAQLNANFELKSDVPEGYYSQIIFDAQGNVQNGKNVTSTPYVNKTMISYSVSVMNNDGYAYAYVYSENPIVNASTYPTLYAADKKTALTSFEDYKVTVSEYGDTVHNYKLKILDNAQFACSNGEPGTYLYYKAGTPTIELPKPQKDVSGNDVYIGNIGQINDGGIGLRPTDANGFSYLYVRDMNAYVTQYGYDWDIKSPFDDAVSEEAEVEEEDDEEDEYAENSTATVNGNAVNVSVSSVRNSDNTAVQAAINTVVYWINQAATNQAEVVGVLNRYAPAMKVSKVLTGGVLELEVDSKVDISSGATITFTNEEIAAQVKSGDKIIVLHVKHDGTIEYIPATAGNGTITATFKSLSPVAWYKVEANGSNHLVSPKTGISFWDFLVNLFR